MNVFARAIKWNQINPKHFHTFTKINGYVIVGFQQSSNASTQ